MMAERWPREESGWDAKMDWSSKKEREEKKKESMCVAQKSWNFTLFTGILVRKQGVVSVVRLNVSTVLNCLIRSIRIGYMMCTFCCIALLPIKVILTYLHCGKDDIGWWTRGNGCGNCYWPQCLSLTWAYILAWLLAALCSDTEGSIESLHGDGGVVSPDGMKWKWGSEGFLKGLWLWVMVWYDWGDNEILASFCLSLTSQARRACQQWIMNWQWCLCRLPAAFSPLTTQILNANEGGSGTMNYP